jgi:predicted deacetylase
MQRCAISIDLDDLACYYRIHGLGAPPEELALVILENAVPRAAELLAAHGAVATWFVVGGDVDDDVRREAAEEQAASPAADRDVTCAREILKALHRGGHELGNHSYSHPYELARLPAEDVAREIGECDRVLRRLTGGPIAGFRAPGYDLSAAALHVLEQRGYRYDSSIFPAPGYYLAKAAVMAGLSLAGRPSGAVLTDPRALVAPRLPYRPRSEAPWRRGASPLVELPIAVTPWLRLPVIGTSLLVAPAPLRNCLLSQVAGQAVFNFELHGIDFADAEEDGIPGELVERQPDLRLSAVEKLERLDAILTRLGRDFAFATLAELAEDAQRQLPG